MYVVVREFRDLKNNDHLYKVGDVYPVKGDKPSKARIKELLTGENKNGKVYIVEAVEEIPEDAVVIDGVEIEQAVEATLE